MKIDHNRYLLVDCLSNAKIYGSIPYIYALQHFALAVDTAIKLSLIERIGHAAFGVLLLIPVLNIFLALADRTVCEMKQNLIIELPENDPYQRGLKHGQRLRSEIQFIYRQQIEPFIRKLNTTYGKNCYLESKKLEQQLSPDIINEMRGLAEGSQVPYNLVLQAHTFLDIFSQAFACSSMGIIFNKNHPKVIATNHFRLKQKDDTDQESCSRYQALESATVSDEKSLPDALKKVNVDTTIQAIIFNCRDRKVLLATDSHQAARKEIKPLSLSSQFPDKIDSSTPPTYLARTLDWPMPALGRHTVTFVTNSGAHKIISIGFPGFIGVLSGMNNKGLALSLSVSGESFQDKGIPKAFLLREVLEQNSDAQSAAYYLHSRNSASSFNVVVASPGQIASIEIDPERSATGIAAYEQSGFVTVQQTPPPPSLLKRIIGIFGF